MNDTSEQTNRLAVVHRRATEEFARAYTSQREVRLQCMEDRRLVSVPGAHWDGEIGEQYANRPRYEVNKGHMSVMRIFSEYRNNRISVDFRPKDGEKDDLAETLDGMYRADEQASGAGEAYDNCFDEGVSGGMGAVKIRACEDDEEDEENDYQRLRIEPIYEADQNVYFDSDAVRQDKADSKRAWVIKGLSKAGYESKWGESPASFDAVERIDNWQWETPELIYVFEYYEIEEEKKVYDVWRLPITEEEVNLDQKSDDYDIQRQDLEAQGYALVRQKVKKINRCHKYIMDGLRVLEDCGRIAGKHIPIVPFYAKRTYVGGVERIQGHIRLTTDLQRLYNMLVSMLADIAVQSPIAKPIVTPEQMMGHEQLWADDNIQRNPYLLLNPVTGPDGNPIVAGPVGYTKPPEIPQALAALMQLCNIDLKELLGNAEAGEKLTSNVSAKAIELVNNKLDMQTFIYTDSFAKTMKRLGEVWLDAAREIYDEEGRKMAVVALDGGKSEIVLKTKTMKDGVQVLENDLTMGRFEVITDVGPSYTTKRDGTVRALTGVLQFMQDPTDQSAVTGVILQNIDGEGLQELKDYNRNKLVRAGVLKPTEEESKKLQEEQANAKPDPQATYLQAEAERSKAMAGKANADTTNALANAENTSAQTAKILAETDGLKLDRILSLMQQLQAMQQPQQTVLPELG